MAVHAAGLTPRKLLTARTLNPQVHSTYFLCIHFSVTSSWEYKSRSPTSSPDAQTVRSVLHTQGQRSKCGLNSMVALKDGNFQNSTLHTHYAKCFPDSYKVSFIEMDPNLHISTAIPWSLRALRQLTLCTSWASRIWCFLLPQGAAGVRRLGL